MRQLDALKSPRFSQISTYARLPHTRDITDVKAFFVGIPFDTGVTYRPGARFGPSAIRQGSRLLRPYNYFVDAYPFDDLNACDYGDIDAIPGYILDTMRVIEKDLSPLARRAVPFIAGGDHSITLPALRAMKRVHGRVNLVHLDSHFDFWDKYWGKAYTHGTWLRRAREEKLLKDVIQGGIRGPFFSKEDVKDVKRLDVTSFTTIDIKRRFKQVVNAIKTLEGKTYVSLDIDVADPAFAPGTGTPETGGLTSLEAIELVRSMELDLVGFDVVEVSPPYDVSELTSLLAANLIYEGMSVFSKRSSGKRRLRTS
jgi:agmatinase